jgi:carbonic anhydrase
MDARVKKRLMEGNHRFVSNKSTIDISEYRRNKISYKQKPFAAVLCCSDSRVPPELIFDQGLGELFVVRTAGTILEESVIESLELGIREFHISLLMVLGHKRCGAVKYAMDILDNPLSPEKQLPYLVQQLSPSIEKAGQGAGDGWDKATRLHTMTVVERLKQSPILSQGVSTTGLEIIMGWYDLDTGIVEIHNG